MSSAPPLSDTAERLQTIAKSKHGDSIMTGREFVDAYGYSGQSLDSEPNRTIATLGGDLQNAYSKVNSVYNRAQKVNEREESRLKTQQESYPLNITAIIGDLERATDALDTAIDKCSDVDVDGIEKLRSQIEDVREAVDKSRQEIEETGIIVLG